MPTTSHGLKRCKTAQGALWCQGWGRSKDQGDCRVLSVVAQAGTDLVDAGPAQQADGSITEEGHHGRPLSQMDRALVLTERHILDPVQPVLNVPAAMHRKGNRCQLGQSSQS